MGIVTRALSRPLSIRNDRQTMPTMSATARYLGERKVGKPDAQLYRDWSIHSPWVRAAFDIRIGQLQRAEYDLVPFSRDLPAPDKGLMRRQREILDQPNPGDSSFGTLIGAVGEDLMALDAGVIEKERMVRGEIAYLWPTDGALIKVDRFWDGNPKSSRYYFEPEPRVSIPLLNSDLIYQQLHRRSYSPVGVSYLETLAMTIQADIAGGMFNARTVMNAAPPGVMDMGENARRDQVDAFASFFGNEIAGKSMMAFWGGTKGAKFIDFHKSQKDMEFMEWLVYLVRQMAAVMQLSPQDLGLMFDVNKSSGEVQQENTENRGLKTLLGAVQDYLTAEFCWDPKFGGARNNIAFRFRAVTDRQSKAMAETQKLTLAGMPSETINEARRDQGKQPIGDPDDESNPYNQLMANTAQGLVRLEDIPTARELAMRPAPSALGDGKPPPSAPAKPAQKGFDDVADMITNLQTKIALARHPLIAEGAIKVQVESPVTVAAPAPDVRLVSGSAAPEPTIDRASHVVKRDTRFVVDEAGRVTGKVETESLEKTDAEIAVDKAGVVMAQQRADSTVAKTRVIETEFITDKQGRIIGKRETERDGDQ